MPISVDTVFVLFYIFLFLFLFFIFFFAVRWCCPSRSVKIATFAFGFSVSCRNTEWSIVPLCICEYWFYFVIFVIKTRILACKKRFALTWVSRLDWTALFVLSALFWRAYFSIGLFWLRFWFWFYFIFPFWFLFDLIAWVFFSIFQSFWLSLRLRLKRMKRTTNE